METIGDRIVQLLTRRGQSKSDLARALGIAPASVTNFCSGKTNPSGQTITMICREYKCSEHWLRTGKGDPFPEMTVKEQIASFFGQIEGDSAEAEATRELIEALAKMPPAYRVQFRDYCIEVAKAHSRRDK